MKDVKDKTPGKKPYEAPDVTATYKKEDIEGIINPHGQPGSVDNYIGEIPGPFKLA